MRRSLKELMIYTKEQLLAKALLIETQRDTIKKLKYKLIETQVSKYCQTSGSTVDDMTDSDMTDSE